MKKCLLIQPGAFGDIFLCAPIAKWYADQNYQVDWPVTKKFLPFLQYFDYVNPIEISDESLHPDWLRSDVMKILPMTENYDKIVNLADRGPHPTAQQPWENFELCKYRLAEVPFDEKNNLKWKRDAIKEDSLFNLLGLSPKDEYAVVHKTDSSGESATIPNINLKTIEVTPIEKYSIFDWFKVFENASEIYCIESSVHQFMDGIVNNLTPERFILKRQCIAPNCRFTVSRNWNLKWVGENSRIVG